MNPTPLNPIQRKSVRLQKNHQLVRALVRKIAQPRKKVLMYCHANFKNPYQMLMYGYFKKLIILPVSLDQIVKAQKAGIADLLHIHWDEFFFRSNDSDRAAIAREIVSKFKLSGGKVIWTVHNEVPHEIGGECEIVEFEKNRHFICENANLIHAHSESARELLVSKYSVAPEKVVVIPHPSYLGWYEMQSEPIRKKNRTFLIFGNLRSYKRIDLVVEAFNGVTYPDRIASLIIAGRGADDVGAEFANGMKVFRVGRYINDESVPGLFGSAEFAVFGFSRILTSGSLMLALTFGVPPIAPAHKSIKDWLPKGLHDLLYTPGNAQDFARVLDYASGLSEADYVEKQWISYAYARQVAPEKISRVLECEVVKHLWCKPLT